MYFPVPDLGWRDMVEIALYLALVVAAMYEIMVLVARKPKE